MSDILFEVKNLSLHYLTRFGNKVHAVSDVSFQMKEGEVLGIAGESGCGKPTLVSGLMGLCIPPLYPTSGDVYVDGEALMNRTPQDIRSNILSQKVSMIPQGALSALNPTRKVKDLAMDVIVSHEGRQDKKAMYKRIFDRFELSRDIVRIIFPLEDQFVAAKIVIEFSNDVDIFFFNVEE